MKGPRATGIGLLLALTCACTPNALPTLPLVVPAPDTGSLSLRPAPYETAVMASGTPSEVYALVARGVLNCWLGARGPLKGSHLFQAEAEPPAKGGAAEIVIHERDVSLRDQRGTRAYRISFLSEAAGVRVGMSALKFQLAHAQAMAKDVEIWAKGGIGCHLPAALPPKTPAPDKDKKEPGARRPR
jgi:hypothetical protein